MQRPLPPIEVVAQLSDGRTGARRATAFPADAPGWRGLPDCDHECCVAVEFDPLWVPSCRLLRAPTRDFFKRGMNIHACLKGWGLDFRPRVARGRPTLSQLLAASRPPCR